MSKKLGTGARCTVAAGLALTAQYAAAETVTANLSTSATVTKNCTVTTSPLAFGNVDVTLGQNVDATGSVLVHCTSGTSYVLSGLPDGIGEMTNGVSLLTYHIYTNSSRTTLWTGNGNTNVSSGAPISHAVSGRVPAGQTSATAGDYTDTVLVTLTY